MKAIKEKIVQEIIRARLIEIEVSAKHIHLTEQDFEKLFGPGKRMTFKRALSQPGQFLAEERVVISGPKSSFKRTAILGPERAQTQVELSLADCRHLGIQAPVRESGDLEGTQGLVVEGPAGNILLKQGVIVAHNHIHLTPDGAQKYGLKDQQRVTVMTLTDRPVAFQDVIVRVRKDFRNKMHIDIDEANAAGVQGFTLGKISE